MKTRAVAIASDRSNAVGGLELECTPHGLSMVYLGMGAFSAGYAPGAVTTGTRVLVPWQQVLEASLEGDQLFLHVDETLTPHNRLLLVHFSAGDVAHPTQTRRRRLLLRVGLGATFTIVLVISALTLHRIDPRAGAAAALLTGAVAAVVLLAIGLLAERRLTRGGADSDVSRAAFVAQLSIFMPNVSVSAERPRPTTPLALPALERMLPRSTAAIVIALSACGLGAILTSTWVLREQRRPARIENAEPAEPLAVAAPAPPPPPAAAPAAPAQKAPAPVGKNATAGEACDCRRGDSVLWRSPIPKLSTLLIQRRERPHKDHVHLELELGVANNSNENINQLSLLVQFYERDPPPSNKRYPTYDRPLFFEGPLLPGQAIKWHVEARGREFEVQHAIEGSIDPSGDNAAPTNRLAELLEANHRPVRLHGAMMLAYLGDARAKAGALRLREALREEEAPYIDRLVRALGDIQTCDLKVEGSAGPRNVSVCVLNTTDTPQSGLGLRVRALDRDFDHSTPVAPPPIVVAESNFKLPGTIPPASGRIASVLFDASNPDHIEPETFEVYADREELLY